MRKENLHTHSLYDDGNDTPQQMAAEAFEKGFQALGFSGHSPVLFDDSTMSMEGMEQWKQDVLQQKREYAGKMDIFLGIELDSFSDIPLEDFEYVIGSIHYLAPEKKPVAIDASQDLFASLLEESYGNDIHALAADYFKAEEALIDSVSPTILGHFDLISKYNEDEKYYAFDDPVILDLAMKAARKAIEKGILFEINTGAIARGYRTTPYPHPLLLSKLNEAGAGFILSSDCHNRGNLETGFDAALEACRQAGITSLAMPKDKDGRLVFEQRPIEDWK